MACGNNQITHSYLAAQPTSIGTVVGAIAVEASQRRIGAVHVEPGTAGRRRLGEFFTPDGRDKELLPSKERKLFDGWHVHDVPNVGKTRFSDQNGDVLLIAKDASRGRTDLEQHPAGILLLQPDRSKVERSKRELFDVLNSRSRRKRQ